MTTARRGAITSHAYSGSILSLQEDSSPYVDSSTLPDISNVFTPDEKHRESMTDHASSPQDASKHEKDVTTPDCPQALKTGAVTERTTPQESPPAYLLRGSQYTDDERAHWAAANKHIPQPATGSPKITRPRALQPSQGNQTNSGLRIGVDGILRTPLQDLADSSEMQPKIRLDNFEPAYDLESLSQETTSTTRLDDQRRRVSTALSIARVANNTLQRHEQDHSFKSGIFFALDEYRTKLYERTRARHISVQEKRILEREADNLGRQVRDAKKSADKKEKPLKEDRLDYEEASADLDGALGAYFQAAVETEKGTPPLKPLPGGLDSPAYAYKDNEIRRLESEVLQLKRDLNKKDGEIQRLRVYCMHGGVLGGVQKQDTLESTMPSTGRPNVSAGNNDSPVTALPGVDEEKSDEGKDLAIPEKTMSED